MIAIRDSSIPLPLDFLSTGYLLLFLRAGIWVVFEENKEPCL